MVPGLNLSQKKSGDHPVKFFEKDSRAYLTGELICLSPLSSGAAVRGTQKSISKISAKIAVLAKF